MKYFGLNELRELFLSYFESKGHLRLPSFPLIPQNDASLLLINSGMAPMKPYFKGEVEPPRHRVCTCQKCIRTGDIENIGKTSRHGTFFEMLGNFSFGDYFKKEAIPMCWEFMTEVCQIDADRLYPSIYLDDEEAFEIWNKDIGIPADRIFRFGKEDNFWEHGSGPCGPCSEVYFDRGEKYGCGKPGCTVGCDCDRYIEIWNNVFSQFDSDGEGHYAELKQKNIDTGMGLERLAVACQDVDSLFDVDTIIAITNRVSELTGATYGQSHRKDVSLRVITDHIRAATFMISDGVLPSNEGRGYVLRRLLRRAARHGKLLGLNHAFLYQICEAVIENSGGCYPELREKDSYITKVIKMEEENFSRTLDSGMRIYGEMLEMHKERGESVFSGADTFKLYDTYGFPVDLTTEMVEDEGMTVDTAAFQQLMQEQKERARAARTALGDLAWAGIDLGLDNTPTKFIGYKEDEGAGRILAIVVGEEIQSYIREGQDGILVLDRTPFYAEMGGQVADHGVIFMGENRFVVSDVQKDKGGKYLHHGHMEHGEILVDWTVDAAIDLERRKAIRRAHSATHLLQAALNTVLGDHCHQAGSLVEPDYLRFDFTHFSPMTREELQKVSRLVGDMILDGIDVETMELPIEEARKLGATALFGEKYGEIVRVVKMGDQSLEFCGGTHLDNTAKVGLFHINAEYSVASGVRRIEAITGKKVLDELDRVEGIMVRVADKLKATPVDLLRKVDSGMQEIRSLKQTVDAMKDKLFAGEADRYLFSAREVRGLKVVTVSNGGMDAADLRKMGDFIRDRYPNAVAVLASTQDDKATLLAICGKNAVARGIKAGDLIRKVTAICGGSGGGKPDSAMGGCKDLMKLDDALAIVDDFVLENAKD
ncbi:MAG: alanine--tRNA ligase [Oscillospiraceae bacterium]|nr:alanine--tRNA ligase [Oscillospiraceae bacterium]